jgi:acyl-CoA thioesterase I
MNRAVKGVPRREAGAITGMKSLRFGSTVMALALLAAVPAAALESGRCAKAASAAIGAGQLAAPALSAAAKDITIVAIGSSSTEGIPSNDKAALYPAMLESELKAARPEAGIKVLNRGKGGEQLAETIARFDRDVFAANPALVIWQLGVNDVLNRDGVEDRREIVRDGMARLRQRGIPVVLLDLQYSPRVNADRDTPAMQEMIADAAVEGVRGRVIHFRRFAAMKALAEKEGVPMSEMIIGDGLHMTDAMHACIGRLLAGMVRDAAANATVAAAAR